MYLDVINESYMHNVPKGMIYIYLGVIDQAWGQDCWIIWPHSCFASLHVRTLTLYWSITGLSLSFNSPVALIFTPVANLLLYGWIVHVSTTCTGQLTHNIKGPSAVTGATGYGPYWQPCINKKKRTCPISSHLDQTSLINEGFNIWPAGKFVLRDTDGSPEQARWPHLAHLASQSECEIWFILLARRTSHLVNLFNIIQIFDLCFFSMLIL